MVVYLLHFQLLPEDRLAELMADLFGVALVPATIGRMSRGCAARFRGFVDAIRERVKAAAVKHMDETGFRIGGRTQWLHIASTALLSFYRACHAANLARERGRPLKPGLIALIERSYDAILAEGIAFHEAQPPLGPPPGMGMGKRKARRKRRIGHNLLLRLQSRRQDVLRFLTNLNVPFTNNQAEQDGRMMKLKQKISGGFRSREGADDFAVIRSFISTARKQGWNVIQALMLDSETLIARLRTT